MIGLPAGQQSPSFRCGSARRFCRSPLLSLHFGICLFAIKHLKMSVANEDGL